jgi:hypothetical protein
MIRNLAGQSIGAQMVHVETGAAFTGTVTAYVTIDAGAQAIGTVGSGICTHEGNGYHTYPLSAEESNGVLVAFTFIGASAIPVTVQVATVTPAQSSALSTATGAQSAPMRTIIADAMTELSLISPGDEINPDDLAFALGKLNSIFDNWNAERHMGYFDVISLYTMVPALQPHTIGPNSATFTCTTRPQQLEGANIVIGTGDAAQRYGLEEWDDADYQSEVLPGISSTLPSAINYRPTWPNGSIYLWPLPQTADFLELRTRSPLDQVTENDTFWLPPGYRNAITLTLAEDIAPGFSRAAKLSKHTVKRAAEARARVASANYTIPKLITVDGGMPADSASSGDFSWRTGTIR